MSDVPDAHSDLMEDAATCEMSSVNEVWLDPGQENLPLTDIKIKPEIYNDARMWPLQSLLNTTDPRLSLETDPLYLKVEEVPERKPSLAECWGLTNCRVLLDNAEVARYLSPQIHQQKPCPNSSKQNKKEEEASTEIDISSPSQDNSGSERSKQQAKPRKPHKKPKPIERIYPCPTCGKLFTRNVNLQRHIATHSKVKSKKLTQRPKLKVQIVFPQKKKNTQKQTDIVQTTSEKIKKIVHSCDSCNTCFDSENFLLNHKECMHKIVNENELLDDVIDLPEFLCDICSQSFKNKQDLKSHISRSHLSKNKFHCEECKKHFSTLELLKSHIGKIHYKKTQKCKSCNNFFTTKVGLKNHQLHLHKLKNNYECLMCNTRFLLKAKLKIHLLKLHGIYYCDSCDVNISNKENMIKHLRNVHNYKRKLQFCKLCPFFAKSVKKVSSQMITHSNIRPFVCNICKKSFKEESVLKRHHRLVHLNPKQKKSKIHINYPCLHCGKEFKALTSLQVHEEIHTAHYSKTCNICDKKFTYKNNLSQHIRFVHMQEKKYKCSECGKKFAVSNKLKRHAASRHIKNYFICKICYRVFKTDYIYVNHNKSAHAITNKIYKCNKCDYKFVTAHLRQCHIVAEHIKQRKITCSICNGHFVQKRDMVNHLYYFHDIKNDDKKYINFDVEYAYENICKLCGQTFVYVTDLKDHINKLHCPVNNCTHCGRNFVDEKQAKTHMTKVHKRERICKCFLCDVAHFSFYGLAGHESSKQNIPNPNLKILCPHCNRQFLKQESLNIHLLTTHTKCTCDICRKTFVGKSTLLSHMPVHNFVKKFRCSYCRYFGGTKEILRAHIDTHTLKGRPFRCQICESRFKHQRSLRQHERENHQVGKISRGGLWSRLQSDQEVPCHAGLPGGNQILPPRTSNLQILPGLTDRRLNIAITAAHSDKFHTLVP